MEMQVAGIKTYNRQLINHRKIFCFFRNIKNTAGVLHKFSSKRQIKLLTALSVPDAKFHS